MEETKKQKLRCSACGAELPDEGTPERFCPVCGRCQTIRYCQICGKELDGKARKYCKSCRAEGERRSSARRRRKSQTLKTGKQRPLSIQRTRMEARLRALMRGELPEQLRLEDVAALARIYREPYNTYGKLRAYIDTHGTLPPDEWKRER